MKLSQRGLAAEESATLAISARAKAMQAQGRSVVNFGVGEPDFNTPEDIRQAAKNALDMGFTRYTPSSGTLELRQAICASLKADSALDYLPSQIVVSNGAKHSLFNAMMALLDDGDEVILPSPCWVSYAEMVRLCGGTPVFVPGDEKDGFCPSIESIEAAITKKTSCLVINNPNNPTGAVWDKRALCGIAKVAQKHDLAIISDEIYDKLVYDGLGITSIASLSDDAYSRTIVINGASKTYAMTGWRIGWAAAPAQCAKVMGNIQSQATSNPNSIAQYAVASALTSKNAEVSAMARAFCQRRDLIVQLLQEIPGISVRKPEGAFYAFPNISPLLGGHYQGEPLQDSMAFAQCLLERQGVATVPGSAFNAQGYIRLSYALSEQAIKEGISRLESFARQIDAPKQKG